jgi:hypothetical protein
MQGKYVFLRGMARMALGSQRFRGKVDLLRRITSTNLYAAVF